MPIAAVPARAQVSEGVLLEGSPETQHSWFPGALLLPATSFNFTQAAILVAAGPYMYILHPTPRGPPPTPLLTCRLRVAVCLLQLPAAHWVALHLHAPLPAPRQLLGPAPAGTAGGGRPGGHGPWGRHVSAPRQQR